MTCVECAADADEAARGWRAFLTVDEEVATFCPECAAREFDAESGSDGAPPPRE
jgi:hypothetical protein